MIEINNLSTNQIDEEFLKRIAKKVLEKEDEKINLSIALVGPERMRKLNKKFLGKNRATDVLSFGQIQNSKFKTQKFSILPKSEVCLREIVICPREVRKNAKRFNLPFEKELAKVLIHGILHILGYDHKESQKKAKEMEERESYYLSLI